MGSIKKDFKYLAKPRLSAFDRGLIWGMVASASVGVAAFVLLMEVIG